MRVMKTAAATLALSAAIGVPAAAASQPKHPHQSAPAKAASKQETYVFRGVVALQPGAGAMQLYVQLNSGNHPAINKLGAIDNTTFIVTLTPTTKLVSWSTTNQPSVNAALTSTMQVGDPVAITIVGSRDANITQLLSSGATRVDDYVLSSRPHGRLFVFHGPVQSVDTVNHTVVVNVTKYNWRAGVALKRGIGASTGAVTFRYDPTATTFVHWTKGKAHLLTPDMIRVGDPLTVKIFSSNYDMHLTSLAAIAAWRMNDHEPMALVTKAIAQSNAHTL
jgi:hypothetical protein